MEYKGHKGHHHGHFKSGGRTPKADVYAGQGSSVIKEAEQKKSGGRAYKRGGGVPEGDKPKKMRLDRPGRKRGGRAGADTSPLTTASKVTEAKDHKAEDDGRAGASGDVP